MVCQCGKTLVPYYLAIAMELPDSMCMDYKSEFSGHLLKCSACDHYSKFSKRVNHLCQK